MTQKTDCCVKYLKKHELKYHEIAKSCNCSQSTVQRAANTHDLNYGQGIKYYWVFNGKLSTELAYVIGAYLTEGSITDYGKHLTVPNTNERFRNLVYNCILSLDAPCAKRKQLPAKSRYKIQYYAMSYSKMFCDFLIKSTQSKHNIPTFLMDCKKEYQLALIAAIIDGDGQVRKDGSIEVRGTHHFLFDLNTIVKGLNIRTNNLRIESILESGLKYRSLSIRRSDFVEIGGYCIIARKMNRILYAKDTRKRKPKEYKKYKCPVCGEITKSKNADMCSSCYLSSDKLAERCRKQASKAGIAGNKVRWG